MSRAFFKWVVLLSSRFGEFRVLSSIYGYWKRWIESFRSIIRHETCFVKSFTFIYNFFKTWVNDDEESWVTFSESIYGNHIFPRLNVFTLQMRPNVDFKMSSWGVLSTIYYEKLLSNNLKVRGWEKILRIWSWIILLGVVLSTDMGTGSDISKCS